MRNVTADTITDAFVNYMGAETDERVRLLLTRLASHIHEFVRETKLTHAEWRKVIELLIRAGKMTDDERNEIVLLSDVLQRSGAFPHIGGAAGPGRR